MNLINIYEAKTKLSQIIRDIEESKQKVIICKNGKPVVDMVIHQKKEYPLRQNEELLGAQYLVDPCEGVTEEDWPTEQR